MFKNYSGIHKGPRIAPLSQNLKHIYRKISQKILAWGYSIYVSDSTRTRSRYLDIPIENNKKLVIRLSDHPPRKPYRFDYDVFTEKPRKNAIDCPTLMGILEQTLKLHKTPQIKPKAEGKK